MSFSVAQTLWRMLLLVVASIVVGALYQMMHPAGLRLSLPASGNAIAAGAEKVRHTLVAARWINQRGVPTASLTRTQPGGAPGQPVQPSDPGLTCSWDEAESWLQDGSAVLVDVRSTPAYEAGHIPGAVSYPIEQILQSPSDFIRAYPPAGKRLVLYCSNVRCSQSAQAAALLKSKYGYAQVWHVPGGFFEWRARQDQKGGSQP